MGKRLKIIHEGILEVGDLEMPCFVLEDGTRVLSGRGFQEAIRVRDRVEGEKRGGYILPQFLESKALNPYITSKLGVAKLVPIECYRGNQKIHGYEASTLADVCDAILEARNQGERLTQRQFIVAKQCEILMRSFAKVGIIALIDEATGYQYDREKDALQKILKSYISEELLPWQKRFPDIFYKELFRLNGWNFTVKGINKRPGVVGTWTNKLIYEQLPQGVNEELRKSTPKTSKGKLAARLHQSLSTDVGNPHLEAQINQIVTLFQLSDNMKHMWQQFEKLKLRQSGQLEIPFTFDDKGHTISDDKLYEEEIPSSFNKSLKQALNYNPNK